MIADSRVTNVDHLPPAKAILCDLSPKPLLQIAGHKFPEAVSEEARALSLRHGRVQRRRGRSQRRFPGRRGKGGARERCIWVAPSRLPAVRHPRQIQTAIAYRQRSLYRADSIAWPGVEAAAMITAPWPIVKWASGLRRRWTSLLASLALAKRLRGFVVPSPECSGEGGWLRIAKQVRDLADR